MKVNGLKTAVKAGELTPAQATQELQARAKVTGYTSEKLLQWLKNRNS